MPGPIRENLVLFIGPGFGESVHFRSETEFLVLILKDWVTDRNPVYSSNPRSILNKASSFLNRSSHEANHHIKLSRSLLAGLECFDRYWCPRNVSGCIPDDFMMFYMISGAKNRSGWKKYLKSDENRNRSTPSYKIVEGSKNDGVLWGWSRAQNCFWFQSGTIFGIRYVLRRIQNINTMSWSIPEVLWVVLMAVSVAIWLELVLDSFIWWSATIQKRRCYIFSWLIVFAKRIWKLKM